mmetsp:Transcript_16773/g.44373  ORF Transcript_16773/g.44373 Transcript_16773/m.44373 type:complete len:275 (-) Transcript_16773:633-1457(-)
MAVTSSETSLESASVLLVRSRMVALPSSTAALSASISSLNRLRVTVLFPISVSQKPSWSASCFASSRSLVIIWSMSFFTLANGSTAACSARSSSGLLLSRCPSAARKACSLPRMPRLSCACALRSSCTRAVARGVLCARPRYFSALPATSGELRISMAFSIASCSSVRSFCFSSKERPFSKHSCVRPFRVISLASFMLLVAASCFLCSADFEIFLCDSSAFALLSLSAFSTESFRSIMIMSYACLEFISSFWHSPSFSLNSSSSFFNISTIDVD